MAVGASVGVGAGLDSQFTVTIASAHAATAMVGASMRARGITAIGHDWDRDRGVVTIH